MRTGGAHVGGLGLSSWGFYFFAFKLKKERRWVTLLVFLAYSGYMEPFWRVLDPLRALFGAFGVSWRVFKHSLGFF